MKILHTFLPVVILVSVMYLLLYVLLLRILRDLQDLERAELRLLLISSHFLTCAFAILVASYVRLRTQKREHH